MFRSPRTRGSARFVALVAVASLTLAACAEDKKETATSSPSTTAAAASAAAPAAGAKPKIGLVMKSLSNEFFQQMDKGAQAYADENKEKFTFKSVGMKDERDFAAQVSAVENFIAEKYDIIVVAPADSKAMVTPLKKAMDAGITVINIDVPLDQEAMKAANAVLPFFGPDNADGAKLAGDALAKKLGKGGKVVILEGNPEADNGKERKRGFEQSIKAGGLELLDSKTAHWETAEANTLVTNYLTRFPELQGIMAANDSMAVGALAALESAGKAGKIEVIGFDNIPAVKTPIEKGTMLATVEQFGAKMAVFGIEYGIKTKNGEKFDGWIKTPIELVETKA